PLISRPPRPISDLRPGPIPAVYSRAWSRLDGELNWNTADLDIYDSILSKSIQAVAEEVLGIYDVLDRRKAPDKINCFLNSQVSAMAAIRLFKRKQRNINPSLDIQPERPGGSALQEFIDKCQHVFFTDAAPFPLPSLEEMDRPDELLVSELLSATTPFKLSEFVREYPKNKACGVDSIQNVLLQPFS